METPVSSKKTKGYTLVEIIVYSSVLALLALVLAASLISIMSGYRSFRVTKNINQSAFLALGRLTRSFKQSDAVNASSTLGVHPGAITLDSIDANGNATITAYYLSNGVLMQKEGGGAAGALTLPSVTVTNFIVRKITTGKSEAVRIELAIQSGSGATLRSEKFYGGAVLRGSYQDN